MRKPIVEEWLSLDGFAADKEVIADKLNAIPKYVLSKSLKEAPWGKWPPARFHRRDVWNKGRFRHKGRSRREVPKSEWIWMSAASQPAGRGTESSFFLKKPIDHGPWTSWR